MTTAMDTAIGQVLKTVRDEGVERDTLVLFFSDNGGPTGGGATNTPLRAGKGTTFEGGIRVPSVMRWPGRLPEGTVSQQVITMMDYFPTLAAAAGVAPGNRLPFDGRNLWPLITAGKTEAREDIFFALENAQRLNLAVHSGPWKLVRDAARGGAGARNLLFRIDDDQEEKNDLAAKEPKVAADLARRIAEWQKLHPPNGVREAERAADWKAPALWAEAAREG
jgi:arylsulfatase A-like enzyme